MIPQSSMEDLHRAQLGILDVILKYRDYPEELKSLLGSWGLSGDIANVYDSMTKSVSLYQLSEDEQSQIRRGTSVTKNIVLPSGRTIENIRISKP